MKGRIFLASGFAALALIIGAVFMAAHGGWQQPASVDEPRVVRRAVQPEPAPKAPPRLAEAEQPFVIRRILPIDGPIKYGEWHWNDKDVPDGPVVITVDLDARVLSVFRNGYEIGATAVLLGTGDTPTPLGVFPITEKDANHVSNIYTGAPMPYMQRLTDDGITLHGSKVELGYASHGCIGMPEPFAAKLFHTTKLGDKVYITRGKRIGMGDNLVG